MSKLFHLGSQKMISENWQSKASGFLVTLCAFLLPISVTGLSIIYPFTIIFSLLNCRHWRLEAKWWRHPVVLVTALYFFLYIIGLTYSDGTWHDRLKDFTKHLWIFGSIL